MKFFFSSFFTLLSCFSLSLSAQVRLNSGNQGTAILVNMHYGVDFPAATMSQRFGRNSQTGGSVEILTNRHNILLGATTSYLFGQTVKEDVLSELRTAEGSIIGKDRIAARIFLRERGIYGGVYLGKIFALSPTNPRSGIRFTVGAGFLQHRIRIQDDSRTVTQITGDYAKGYDRLTNGLAVQSFLGYHHLSRNRGVNFYAGFELTKGFTQSRRDWDFNLQAKDTRKRNDLLYGLKIGWTLPFYVGENGEEIYY